MNGHVYKVIEVVGSSPEGLEAAINNGIHEAAQSLRQMRWFEVAETRGHIEDGVVAHWQVTLKIGFTMEANR